MAQSKKSNVNRPSGNTKKNNQRNNSRPNNSKGGAKGNRQGWTPPPPKSKLPLIGGLVGGAAVVIVVVVLLVVSLSSSTTLSTPDTPLSAQLASAITQVSPSIFNQVGTGSNNVVAPPTTIKGSSLTLDGKPEVLYMGSGWCPYCGAERWALIVALSRFGTFTGLEQGFSSSTDSFPSTPTFGFQNSTFTSNYLTFVPVEMQDVNRKTLETPTSQENSLMNQYDPKGSIPFIDVYNKWLINAEYSPQLLSNLDHNTIASTLTDPTNPTAQAIIGSANYLDAVFCNVDGYKPASVCTSSGVTQALASLKVGVKPTPGQHSSTPSTTKATSTNSTTTSKK